MTVELTTASGPITLHDAALDRAARTWHGNLATGAACAIPIRETSRQRLVVDAEGRPVGGGNIDSDQHRGRRRRKR